MTDMYDMDDSPEQADFYQWLEELELDFETPLADLIDDPAWLEPVTFEPDDLAHLDELAREYAQELFEHDAIPDVPPMDLDEHLLEPVPEQTPEPTPEHDLDLDFDR